MEYLKKICLSLVVVGSLYSFNGSSHPYPMTLVASFLSFGKGWQNLKPDPSRENLFLIAEVTFEDSSSDVFVFPRTSEASTLTDFSQSERFRFFLKNLTQQNNQRSLKDVSKFALRKLKSRNFRKIPLKVDLNLYKDIVPAPDKKFRRYLESKKSFTLNNIFTYEVL